MSARPKPRSGRRPMSRASGTGLSRGRNATSLTPTDSSTCRQTRSSVSRVLLITPHLFVAPRITHGITQRELAERLNVHESQVSRDERNDYHGITVDRAGRLLDVLGVDTRTAVLSVGPIKSKPLVESQTTCVVDRVELASPPHGPASVIRRQPSTMFQAFSL